MKLKSLTYLIPVALALVACDTRQVRTAKHYGMVDHSMGSGDKGYVEFRAEGAGAPVAISHLDAKGRPHVVGAVGMEAGDRYSKARYGVDVTEKLRVAVPSGNSTFIVEHDGERVKVPVTAGQVTPVAIHYVRLEKYEHFETYRVNSDVGSPRMMSADEKK